jgi:hypothetical protein
MVLTLDSPINNLLNMLTDCLAFIVIAVGWLLLCSLLIGWGKCMLEHVFCFQQTEDGISTVTTKFYTSIHVHELGHHDDLNKF